MLLKIPLTITFLFSLNLQAQEIKDFYIQPNPTGKYQIGRIELSWADDSRKEKMSQDTNEIRRLMVHIYFPADINKTSKKAEYIPYLKEIKNYEDNTFGKEFMKDEYGTAYDSLFVAKPHSYQNVSLSQKKKKYPVLLFQPGLGMKIFLYTTIIEDIVSHGYIVAAIEPTYETSVVVFPSGKIISESDDWDKKYKGADSTAAEFHFNRILENAKDNSFVLTQLEKLNKGELKSKEVIFKGTLDLSRVGVFGHSQGGMVARETILSDKRFKAAINLDGTFTKNIEIKKIASDSLKTPFLYISSNVQNEKIKNWQISQFTNPTVPAYFLKINTPGFTHTSFYDFEISDEVRTFNAKKGLMVDRIRDIFLIRESIHAYFDKYLLQKNENFDMLTKHSSEILIEKFEDNPRLNKNNNR